MDARFSRVTDWLGDAGATQRLLAAASDVTLVLDRDGVIRDVATGDPALAPLKRLIGHDWREGFTIESRPKIQEMLAEAGKADPRWRQINYRAGDRDIPLRFVTIRTGDALVAVGRDLSATAALQQRLLAAQQSMERDYVRLRQAESRYRLLFEAATEAVLIVDAATRRISEANPAAQALAGGRAALAGQSFASILHPEDREPATALLGAVAASGEAKPIAVRVDKGKRGVTFSATLFRQDRTAFFLIRLTAPPATPSADARAAERLIEQVPDPFVLTDDSLNVLALNAAFLDLTGAARREDVMGAPLVRHVGRPGIDLTLLAGELREHRSVVNFATIVRDRHGQEHDVELSAVAASENGAMRYGFTFRRARVERGAPRLLADDPQSVEQLTRLVGRVSLKEIVRESTDLIERLCIEAALQFTADNRASAAELLGLSRQSLYSKLHRHGLVNASDMAD